MIKISIFYPNVTCDINGTNCCRNIIDYMFEAQRVIFLNSEINDDLAMSVISQLMYLDSISREDIILCINSCGGSISSGMAIYDCMKSGINCDVMTFGTGLAASMAATLLASGTKGKRFASPNAQIMIHQPWSETQGQVTDIMLAAHHLEKVKMSMTELMAKECSKDERTVARDYERNTWMSSTEALEYGLIDYIGCPEREVSQHVYAGNIDPEWLKAHPKFQP